MILLLKRREKLVIIMSDSEVLEIDLDKVGELDAVGLSPRGDPNHETAGNAPPPRRKSFSKLRRRLSQTFRFSLNGSLAELSGGFGDRTERTSNGKNSD